MYHFMSKSTGRVKMNDGKRTFLKQVLRQGQAWNGPLAEVPIRPTLKDRIKRLLA